MKPQSLPIEYESAGADFDEPARVYRYHLHRMWGGGSLSPWRTVLWIMLNPSTADERVLDNTLRRCQAFSRAWGYDGFEVANLFALRSTKPAALFVHQDPVGPGNDAAIATAIERADLIVCGWGTHATLKGRRLIAARASHVRHELLATARTQVRCLGRTQDGQPKHPLYLAQSTALVDFAIAA